MKDAWRPKLGKLASLFYTLVHLRGLNSMPLLLDWLWMSLACLQLSHKKSWVKSRHFFSDTVYILYAGMCVQVYIAQQKMHVRPSSTLSV